MLNKIKAWFRNRKITKLEEKIAVLSAEIRAEANAGYTSSYLEGERAKYKFRLEKLRG